MHLGPGEWQVYDIRFIAPRDKDGQIQSWNHQGGSMAIGTKQYNC